MDYVELVDREIVEVEEEVEAVENAE
jgi:hypothetical protein